MESLDRELTLEIPHNMNFNGFAAHFITSTGEASKRATIQLINATSKATISSSDPQQQRSTVIGNQFLQKLGETLFGFGGSSAAAGHSIGLSNSDSASAGSNMDLLRNHIVIDSTDFDAVAASATSDLQQQLEYDKFMNEIWIGIVLTLIIISLVFCICSCFLYHQFRQWKMNYRHNLQQAQDIESVKLNPDSDDPVPEYTLVSGLPSYEAALELLQNSTASNGSRSCLIVYPSLFNVFSMNEKDTCEKALPAITTTTTASATEATTPQTHSIGGAVTSTITMAATTPEVSQNVKCQNVPRLALHSIPSYEEATACQPQQHQTQSSDTFTCLVKSPPTWCEDTAKVLLMEKKN